MQSTLSALVITPGEAHLGHVGDSRIYRRRDGELELLTTDHSQVMELLRMHIITPGAGDRPSGPLRPDPIGRRRHHGPDRRPQRDACEPATRSCSAPTGCGATSPRSEIAEALAGDPGEACRRWSTSPSSAAATIMRQPWRSACARPGSGPRRRRDGGGCSRDDDRAASRARSSTSSRSSRRSATAPTATSILAEDPSGRQVVLKCPHESIMGDVSTFDRFRRELEIVAPPAPPGHPAADRVHRATAAGPTWSWSTSTARRCGRSSIARRSLSVDQAVDFGQQLAAAMAYAHAQGVVHRDLKPENVLVTPDGRLVVTDFGVAFMAGARRLTWRWFSTALGTPDYMSPEQIQGKRGDARTDVYAIGVMLYEMLAGRVPWEGDNALSVMSQHINAPVPPLHEINKDVPPPDRRHRPQVPAQGAGRAVRGRRPRSSRTSSTGATCRSRSSSSATRRS